MGDIPSNRSDAKKVGAPSYFTGKQCKNGHIAERSTKKGECMECNRERAKEYYYIVKTDPSFIEMRRARDRARYAKKRIAAGYRPCLVPGFRR